MVTRKCECRADSVLTIAIHNGRLRKMGYSFDYSEEKSILLKETRGVGFEDIVEAWEKGWVIDDLVNNTHPNQRMLVVRMKNYIYLVPYVVDKKRKKLFLKTVYPSREMVKKYGKKGEK